MMCKKCGCEIGDQAKFCSSCGTPREEPQVVEKESKGTKKLKMGKKAVFLIAAAGVIVIAVVLLLNRKPVIDLNQYVKIEVNGFDGYGSAAAYSDYEAFEQENKDKIKYSSKSSEADLLWLVYASPMSAFRNLCFTGTFQSDENLANGDVVRYTWTCDETTAEEVFGVKLNYNDIEYKISELQELTEVDIMPYLTIDISGYDGYGTAEAFFDTEKFVNDYSSKVNGDESIEETYKMSAVELLADSCVSGGFASACEKSLSNGDVVRYSWNCDNEFAARMLGVKLICNDVERVAEGLEALEEIDLFDYITVTFSGISPRVTVEIQKDDTVDVLKGMKVVVENSDNLSLGDQVTLRLARKSGEDVREACAVGFGIAPKMIEKQYTVAGELGQYITTLESVPDEIMEEMKAHAAELHAAEVKGWIYPETLKGREYVGAYFLTERESAKGGKYANQLYLVYEITVDKRSSIHGTFTYCYAVAFCDIYTTFDGGCKVNFHEAEPVQNTAEFFVHTNSGWNLLDYTGYDTIEDFVEKEVSAQGSLYRCEQGA